MYNNRLIGSAIPEVQFDASVCDDNQNEYILVIVLVVGRDACNIRFMKRTLLSGGKNVCF